LMDAKKAVFQKQIYYGWLMVLLVGVTTFVIVLGGLHLRTSSLSGMSETQVMSEVTWSIDIILAITIGLVNTVVDGGMILETKDPICEWIW